MANVGAHGMQGQVASCQYRKYHAFFLSPSLFFCLLDEYRDWTDDLKATGQDGDGLGGPAST